MVPKFRAWDEIQHKMLQVDYIEFIDGKAYWVEASSADDNPQGGNDGPVRDNSQLKLEQYTGLKDVNGKEIYEGDILEYYYETRGQTFYDPDTLGAVGGEPGIETTVIGRVAIWPSTGVVLTGIKAKYPEDFDSSNSDIPKTLHVNRRFEVVGNVHENLELLEEE